MTARRSTPVRWAEEAEAARMRATAMFEREPQNIAACPVTIVLHPVSLRRRFAVMLSRLAGEGLEIVRDGGR
ncbi:MAG TPA: hypothetical protein VGM07_02385 [Stellaceae bacterium]|jgi:hypothetical protein